MKYKQKRPAMPGFILPALGTSGDRVPVARGHSREWLPWVPARQRGCQAMRLLTSARMLVGADSNPSDYLLEELILEFPKRKAILNFTTT